MTDTTSNFSKTDLRQGFKGHLYNGHEFVGGVYLLGGKGYVLAVEDGRVEQVIRVHAPQDFRKAGRSTLSESRSVQHWELAT